MDKSSISVLGAAITASVATPAIFLSSNSNKPISKFKWKGIKIPELEKSSDIKKKYKEVDCLKDFGESVEWSSKVQSGVPGENFVHDNDISKSCLIVEYYKQTITENTWRGGFRLIWSISGNNLGLVTIFNADTNDEKLILESSVYVLMKENDNWSAKYKSENSKKNITSNSDLSSYFPKPGTILNIGETNNYWGFNPDVSKICKGDECFGNIGSPTSNTWNWKKEDSSSNNVTEWSSNYEGWFQNMFSDWYQTPNQFGHLKGTWTKYE